MIISRAGSVGHRVNGPEEVPDLWSVGIIKCPERSSSQMGEMVKHSTQTSVYAIQLNNRVVYSHLHPRITPIQSNAINAPTPHCIGIGGVGGKMRAISEWG